MAYTSILEEWEKSYLPDKSTTDYSEWFQTRTFHDDFSILVQIPDHLVIDSAKRCFRSFVLHLHLLVVVGRVRR